jgi:hypothetical protein
MYHQINNSQRLQHLIKESSGRYIIRRKNSVKLVNCFFRFRLKIWGDMEMRKILKRRKRWCRGRRGKLG